MTWTQLTSVEQLDEVLARSTETPQVIFKHSNRCSISSVAYQRLQKADAPGNISFYLIDVILHRSLSLKVAEMFGVTHESPQVLLIRDRQCVYDESHMGITMRDIARQVHSV